MWSFGSSLAAALLYNSLTFVHATPTGYNGIFNRQANSSGPVVTVKNGSYEGLFSDFYNQDWFLGMPFAQVPLGELRFNNPVSLNTTFTLNQATAYAPECIGYGGDDIGYPQSEDCLYLNVIRPAGISADAKLPVATWIHGGGLVMGGTRDRRYNLTFIVENSVAMGQPMIGVSIGYRLDAWGFLNSKEALAAGVTNVGFKDQRLALHWINENIEAFGGDKDKVTIWGESSGGQSVGTQAIAFGGRDDGLFRAVIAESGGPAVVFNGDGPGFNSTGFQTAFDTLLNRTGCADIECLRGLPFDTVNNALNGSSGTLGPFGPAIDGDFIQDYPSKQLADGRFVKVPLLIGCNTDEGTAFGRAGINTDAQFAAAVASQGPDNETVAIIEALYPNIPALGIPNEETYSGPENASLAGAQWKRSAAYFGDSVVIGPRRHANNAWANFNVTTYGYNFDVVVNGLTNFTGATHFQEVAFVFDNVNGDGYAVNPFEGEPQSFLTLATQISRSWVGFVTELDPNQNGLDNVNEWPKYTLEGGIGQIFTFTAAGDGTGSFGEADDFRAEGIAFIEANALSQFGR